MNFERICLRTIEKLNPDDQEKCKKFVFLAIFAGIFVEPTIIAFLLHFWFNDKDRFGKSFPRPGLKKPQMELVVNLVCRCENIVVAQKNAQEINAILSFFSDFKSDGVLVPQASRYMNQILNVPTETAEKKVYEEIAILTREQKEWDNICKISGISDIQASTIRKQQISDLKKTIQIIDIMKHLKPLKTPADLVALVKVMFLYSVADFTQRDASQDEHTIQQIVRTLTMRDIILVDSRKNAPKATPATRLVQISEFFGELKQNILDKIYPVSPESRVRRLSLLGYFLECRFIPHYFSRLPCPPQLDEFSAISDFVDRILV